MPGLLAAAAALLWLLALSAPAAADDKKGMSFDVWHNDQGVFFGGGSRDYIFADGDFVGDTATQFQQYLAQHPPRGPNTTIVLNSNGGDLAAGLALGRIIREHKFWTQVGAQWPLNIGVSPTVPRKMVPYLREASAPPFPGYCYSSCTFAFLGGVYRFMEYGSIYGVHRFAFSKPEPGTDLGDIAQVESGELVRYVAEMGAKPEFITEMSLKGPSDINHLTFQRMVDLDVITPRWHTSWQITPLPDNSGFYLGGYTWDEWGSQEIDFTCSRQPPASGPNKPQPGPPQLNRPGPNRPAGDAVLLATFYLDPGARAKAADLVGAVKNYTLGIDEGYVVLPDSWVAERAAVATGGKRLSVLVQLPAQALNFLLRTNHIGFAVLFDPAKQLPMRLLQFESDLDAGMLKSYAATCH